jgi:hypothetical protein
MFAGIIDAFVSANSGGLNGAFGLTFGPDGNLYGNSEAPFTGRRGGPSAFATLYRAPAAGPAAPSGARGALW